MAGQPPVVTLPLAGNPLGALARWQAEPPSAKREIRTVVEVDKPPVALSLETAEHSSAYFRVSVTIHTTS